MARERAPKEPQGSFNTSLFEGLEEPDKDLLRRQIELNYVKAKRKTSVWLHVLAFSVCGAIAYFTKPGEALHGQSWSAINTCTEGLTCSDGRADDMQGLILSGFFFFVMGGALLGWVTALISVNTSEWRNRTVAQMFNPPNLPSLNQAASLARLQVDNTVAHRRLQNDFKGP